VDKEIARSVWSAGTFLPQRAGSLAKCRNGGVDHLQCQPEDCWKLAAKSALSSMSAFLVVEFSHFWLDFSKENTFQLVHPQTELTDKRAN
jgi:hypothetical protein